MEPLVANADPEARRDGDDTDDDEHDAGDDCDPDDKDEDRDSEADERGDCCDERLATTRSGFGMTIRMSKH